MDTYDDGWTRINPNPVKARCLHCGHLTIIPDCAAPTLEGRLELLIERHREHTRPACALAHDERRLTR